MNPETLSQPGPLEAEPSADPNLGRLIAGLYRLDAVLGSGASGVVYRAEHLGIEAPVAVKLPNPELISNPATKALFRREARAAARFNHPNSVQVLDFGTEPDGLVYVVMELVEGRELLAAILDESPMPPARIVHILGQVLGALAAAHDAGIVHRDVKPENILLVEHASGETAKLADFGIAKPFGGSLPDSAALTIAGMLNGTPTYMAPEQASGAELDGRADLYAVGAILYEMLCGTPPFLDEKPFDLILAHLMRAPSPPSERRAGVSPALEAVAMRALAKKPENRYADARAMRAALFAALDDDAETPRLSSGVDDDLRLTVPLVVAPARAPTRERARRRCVQCAVVAAVAVLIAVAAVVGARTAFHGEAAPRPVDAAVVLGSATGSVAQR